MTRAPGVVVRREARRLLSFHSMENRFSPLPWAVVFTSFVPISLVAFVTTPDRRERALVMLAIGVGAVLGLVAYARWQADRRWDVTTWWSDGPLADAARRYRLHPGEAPLPADLPLHLFAKGSPPWEVTGMISGEVRGRQVVLFGLATSKGVLHGTVAAAVRVRRARTVPDPAVGGLEGVRRRASERRGQKDALRRRRGAPDDVPAELRRWCEEEANRFRFGIAGAWVTCDEGYAGFAPPEEALLPAAELGVWLAALVGFANRWDAA